MCSSYSGTELRCTGCLEIYTANTSITAILHCRNKNTHLTLAKQGETVTIRKITGKDEIRQHLAELGFVVDGTVTVVSELGGNLIVQVKDSRIALDRTMANRVMI